MFYRVKENKLINPLIVNKFLAIIIYLRSLDVHRFLRGAAEAAAGRGSPPPPGAARRGGRCECEAVWGLCFLFVSIDVYL